MTTNDKAAMNPPEPLPVEPQPPRGKLRGMVHWYDPLLLIRTGIRSLLATSVGQITDNREMQTAAPRGPASISDYSDNAEIWLDFVADIGDGFQSTHAIATCLASPELIAGVSANPSSQEQATQSVQLPRADLVVCGGDLVYPDPSIATYMEATFEPYQRACDELNASSVVKADFFALPGNHDWYDGLQAFEDLLCHDDPDAPRWPLGHWRKPQTHSYFSLALPHNWWLLGVDFQLDGRINPSQRRYFKSVISQLRPGAQIILCVASPYWTIPEPGNEAASVAWLSELCTQQQANIRLILTGDLHHYSRYVATSVNVNRDIRQDDSDTNTQPTFVTAGGGGAFLHPTHSLPELGTAWTASGGAQATQHQRLQLTETYPTKPASRWLSLHNLKFPILNWEISLLAGFLYTLLAWILETRFITAHTSLADRFQGILATHTGVWSELLRLFSVIPQSPEFALIVLLALGAFVGFNGDCTQAKRWALGITHTLFHLLGLCITYCLAIELTIWLERTLLDLTFAFVWLLLTMLVIGGGVGGVVFGVFLIVSSLVFNANVTNAFSSIRLASHKNFLRLHVNSQGILTLYSLGLTQPAKGAAGVHLIEQIRFENRTESTNPTQQTA